MAEKLGWVVKTPNGDLLGRMVWKTRVQAIISVGLLRFLGVPWKTLYRKGYRAVMVRIVEEGRA